MTPGYLRGSIPRPRNPKRRGHAVKEIPDQSHFRRQSAHGAFGFHPQGANLDLEQFQHVLESINDGLGVIDQNGVITYVNRGLCEMFGYTREEMIGHTVIGRGLLDEENQAIFTRNLRDRETEGSNPYNLVFTRKDGSWIHTLSAPTNLVASDGTPMGSYAVITDISEIVRAWEEIRTAHNRLVEAIETLPEGLYCTSTPGSGWWPATPPTELRCTPASPTSWRQA